MLIQFSVKNYRSIKDEITLSLLAKKQKDMVNNSFIANYGKDKNICLLPSIAIYGPNASGKSNIIKAMDTMKRIVCTSHEKLGELRFDPFRFDKASLTEPSVFDATFIVNNIKYQYGFSLNNERILGEWLYVFSESGRSKKIFTREYSKKANKYDYEDNNMRGRKSDYRKTRDDALYLSTGAVLYNNETLRQCFNWFYEKLEIFSSVGIRSAHTALQCINEPIKTEKILEFLNYADFSIKNIEAKESKVSISSIEESKLPDLLKQQILKDLSSGRHLKSLDIQLEHPANYDNGGYLPYEEESDGTQKMFELAGPWIDMLEKGKVIFYDELNNSLHPLLTKFLISKFHKHNENHAQLVFSTHDTLAMDQQFLSRDQIWFCVKNNQQVTGLYSLLDFNHRSDIRDIEKAYLSGRYGAIPNLKEEL